MANTDAEKQAVAVAGAVGGPLSIFLYTPLRNAITLGSQDARATAAALYRRTVEQGWLRGGYAGFATPTVFSCPQFIAMGPLYHYYSTLVGHNLAVVPTALTESAISYGSQARNAQIAYNLTVPAAQHVPLQVPWNPLGAGFVPHTMRNMCAMSGIRVLSTPIRSAFGADARDASPTISFGAARGLDGTSPPLLCSLAQPPVSLPSVQHCPRSVCTLACRLPILASFRGEGAIRASGQWRTLLHPSRPPRSRCPSTSSSTSWRRRRTRCVRTKDCLWRAAASCVRST